MSTEEIKAEIKGVLGRLGFEIFEKDFEIVASRDKEKVRVEMRFVGKSNLNIPQTEVIFECAENVHAEIIFLSHSFYAKMATAGRICQS